MNPEHALRMQADLRTQLLSTDTHKYVGIVLTEEHDWDVEPRIRDRVGQLWCEAERESLAEADTYLMASNMRDLVLLNAQTMPLNKTVVTEFTPPTKRGFLVFEDALGLVDAAGRASFYTAMSWHVLDQSEFGAAFNKLGNVELSEDRRVKTGILLQFYRSFQDSNRDWFLMSLFDEFDEPSRQNLRRIGEPHMAKSAAIPCDLDLDSYMRSAPKGWGEAPDDDLRSYLWPQLVVISIWDIMAQTLMVERQPVAMTEKRREGWRRRRIPGRISVVLLRRQYESMSPEPRPATSTGVTYGHRWKVKAHPHRYRVGPGRKEVITKWIETYEKGPEDAPLIDRPKVTKLGR